MKNISGVQDLNKIVSEVISTKRSDGQLDDVDFTLHDFVNYKRSAAFNVAIHVSYGERFANQAGMKLTGKEGYILKVTVVWKESRRPVGRKFRAVSAAVESGFFASVLEEVCPSLKTFESADVSVAFVSSDSMKSLNLEYRELDEPTDVLSFPLWEEEGAFVPSWSGPDIPLGDVVICEQIVRNAAKNREFRFRRDGVIFSHGVLHLSDSIFHRR